MTKLIALSPLLILLLCGFMSADKPAVHLTAPLDSSDTTINMFKDGTMEGAFYVAVHADPVAGQYWEVASTASDTTATMRWQVTSVEGTTAIIEYQSRLESRFITSNYVLAYEVNLAAKKDEANVTKGWVGRPGKEGTEITIMKKPEADPSDNPSSEVTEEAFKDLELAGQTWSGKKMIYKGRGWESTAWVADKGWFDATIKTQSGDYVTELKKKGDDAKALLTLPKVKEEAKEEKKDDKEEKKDEEKN